MHLISYELLKKKNINSNGKYLHKMNTSLNYHKKTMSHSPSINIISQNQQILPYSLSNTIKMVPAKMNPWLPC